VFKHVAFCLHFLPGYAKTRTSNFCKVVQQHTEGVMGSFVGNLLGFLAVKEF